MQNNYRLALDQLVAMLQNSHETSSVHYNLGVCYYNLNRYEEARRSFLKAKELGGTVPDFIFQELRDKGK